MGDIKKELNNSNYENQLINILRGEEPKSKKQFKLKGPTNFLFSNFAMLALAACGGGGVSISTTLGLLLVQELIELLHVRIIIMNGLLVVLLLGPIARERRGRVL